MFLSPPAAAGTVTSQFAPDNPTKLAHDPADTLLAEGWEFSADKQTILLFSELQQRRFKQLSEGP